MKADSVKLLFSYLTAILLIAGTYYALVLYPFVLDPEVKLWLTGAAGGAIAFVFGDQIATRAKVEQQSAFDKGLGATPNQNGSAEPPVVSPE